MNQVVRTPLTRLLSDKEIRSIYGGWSRPTLYRRRRDDPTFPKPVKITPGLNGTFEDEVIAHLAEKKGRLTHP